MLRTLRRLKLRPFTAADAADLYKYARDPEVGPAAGWPAHTSVAESREIIRTALSAPEQYAICRREDNRVIGAIGLKLKGSTRLTERDDACELGYWLGKPFWGQGLMPEAAEELLRHAFEDLRMQRVWCAYYDGNEKSKRVQEKLGFRYQRSIPDVDVSLLHETRTEHVNVITREEWRRRHST